MDYRQTPYFKVGRATELEGNDRRLYRFFEMVPGILTWGTILGTIFLSYFFPVIAAFFIIVFDLYWLLKTIYLSIHLRQNWRRTVHSLEVDWSDLLSHVKYEHLYHLVILPYYSESYDIVHKCVESLVNANGDHKKILIVLAPEEKIGAPAQEIAKKIEEKFAHLFGGFVISTHPFGVPGEMAGKGSNIAYAAEYARIHLLDEKNISYKDVLVSAFDIDTVIYKDYFLCLMWHFLTAEKPYRSSYQPVPFYNNNIWEAPALSRVVAGSGTFWQMIQQERPEKLTTFSSHAIPFQTLYELGYWQKNMVSEDSRIFWNALLAFNGDYRVVSLSYPVSMDANLAPTFFETLKNIYKQQRRWAYGSENVPYILMGFVKNKLIPLRKKITIAFVQLEGYWSLATNPLLIFLLGWLPLILGGHRFNQTVLSYNLPFITRNLMVLAMFGLVVSGIIFWSLLPDMPQGYRMRHKIFMIVQWVLVPFTIVIFGAIPGVDAQTRLLFGKYMGFWVTPKHRGGESSTQS